MIFKYSFLPLIVFFSYTSFSQEHRCFCDCRAQVEQMYIRDGMAIGNEPILKNAAQAIPWCTNYVNNILMVNDVKEQQVVGRSVFSAYFDEYEIYMCEAIKKGRVLGFGASEEEAKKEALKACQYVMGQHLNVSTTDVQYKLHSVGVFLDECRCGPVQQ